MSAGETVECDGCGLKVRLRADDTYGKHRYTAFGAKTVCDRWGTPYSRHRGEFHIFRRDPNQWVCNCRCGEVWTGAEYADVEGPWLEHCTAARAEES